MAPRPYGVDPDDAALGEAWTGSAVCQSRSNSLRAREPGRQQYTGRRGCRERRAAAGRASGGRRRRTRAGLAAAVREAARDLSCGELLDEPRETPLRLGRVVPPEVQVGTWRMRAVTPRSLSGRSSGYLAAWLKPRDLRRFLGLRAGGALRKRRGETDDRGRSARPLAASLGRAGAALGAFAVGTFGLRLTLGGLIFGRWRKAKADSGFVRLAIDPPSSRRARRRRPP